MGLAELLSTLDEETDAEVRQELTHGRDEAARIVEETAANLSRRRDEVLSSRESELRREAEASLARARREARREVLSARQRVLDRIFESARAELANVASRPEFDGVLRRDIDDALSLLAPTKAVVRCARALEDRVRAIVGERAAIEIDDAIGIGIEVLSEERTVRIDQTLATRLDRLRGEIAIAITERIGAERP